MCRHTVKVNATGTGVVSWAVRRFESWAGFERKECIGQRSLVLRGTYRVDQGARSRASRVGISGNLVRRKARRGFHPPAEVEEGDQRGRLVDRVLAPPRLPQRVDVAVVNIPGAFVSFSAYSRRDLVFASRSYVRHVVANSNVRSSSPVRRRTAAV